MYTRALLPTPVAATLHSTLFSRLRFFYIDDDGGSIVHVPYDIDVSHRRVFVSPLFSRRFNFLTVGFVVASALCFIVSHAIHGQF